ncbi:hypothetical protein KAR91_39785 [Candidatus Pacearchaeota archaeon]|nr:hypothetical protein [Candidatus Pacearchaeota archaeon]
MENNNSVLLLIDQRQRDAIGILLIYHYLKKFGCKVYLCNKNNMLITYDRFKPKVVAFSDTGTYFSDWCRYMAKKSLIVLIPQEGGIPDKEMAVKRHILNDVDTKPFTEEVAKVFLWGQQTADWLMEEGIFREDQIVVSGTPRLDVYRFKNEMKDNSSCRVGFANRGESINMVRGSMVRRIDDSKYNRGGVESYTGKDRNWEDWIWHSVAQMRHNFILMEKLGLDNSKKIIFRTDPYEKIDSYNYLKNKYGNFEINNNPSLKEYLSLIDVLVTEFSTTGIEALIMKKPVISIQKIIGPRLLDHNDKKWHVNTRFMKYYWQPETIDEAMDMINKVVIDDLPYTPYESGLKVYLKNFYDWPRENPSSLTIAKEIFGLIEKDVTSPESIKENNSLPSIHMVERINKSIPILKKNQISWLLSHIHLINVIYFLIAIRNKNFYNFNRSEFNPWHYYDLKKAHSIWKNL